MCPRASGPSPTCSTGRVSEHLHHVDHEGDGPAALVVHGAIASRSYWDDNIAALSEVCRPTVLELWGHGLSPSPAEPDRYTPDGYNAEFEYHRERLGIEKVWMIGQSMGAALVLHYAVTHPDRIHGLVLTNSTSAFTPPKKWAEFIDKGIDARVRSIEEQGMAAIVEDRINPGRSRRIPEHVRSKLIAEFDEHDPTGLAMNFRYSSPLLALGDRLENVGAPALLTNGVDEKHFQPLLPQVRRIPGIEIVDLPASHAVNAHDPDGWNTAVTAFISRHP